MFIKEFDYFGVKTPPKAEWITDVELYKNVAKFVPRECIAGIQRVRGLWRLYMDNDETRKDLLTCDFSLRGKSIPIYNSNPGIYYHMHQYKKPTMRVIVKNVPLSADDAQIKRVLQLQGCEIISFFREKLRVDGLLTNCENGNRIAIVSELEKTLPTSMEIGKYRAVIYHRGQTNDKLKCNKCLETGHVAKNCENEVVCKSCGQSGHIMAECPASLLNEDNLDTLSGQDDDNHDAASIEDNIQSSSSSEEDDAVEDEEEPPTEVPTEVVSTKSKTDKPKTKHDLPKHTPARVKLVVNKKQAKKGKKSTSYSVPMNTSNTHSGTLDTFFSAKGTPSRKSNAVPPESHSPVTPTEEKEARERVNKKQRDGPT